MEKPFPFKIGADPEFNLFEDGNNVSAKTVMQRIFKRKEKEELGYRMDIGGSIGWDSWIRTAEIRPLPAYTPKGLTENIKILLNTIQDKLPTIEMSTKSDPDPVGGHIHFEIDTETANNPEKLKNIHRWMSLYYMTIIQGEDSRNTEKRNNIFRKTVEYNTKNEQTFSTYEFKKPNAEWLINPHIAQATLACMGTIFAEIIKSRQGREQFEDVDWKRLEQIKNLIEKKERQGMNFVERLKNDIRTFEFYPVYQKEIEYLFRTKEILKEKQNANFYITNLWNV